MMLEYIILGIIQGLTEFFPVSSSAHLVILEKIMNINSGILATTIILHLGTCLALVCFFFQDILKALKDLKLILFILVVTLITGLIGITGKDFFENLFGSVKFVAAALIVTGIILIIAQRFLNGKRSKVNFPDALILGITQAIAIIPGISRSGITISTLCFRQFDRLTAFRISFLAAIPAVLGAALLEIKDISLDFKASSGNLIIGFLASFLSGLIALYLLKALIQKAKLYYFGYYCIIIAIVTLIFIK